MWIEKYYLHLITLISMFTRVYCSFSVQYTLQTWSSMKTVEKMSVIRFVTVQLWAHCIGFLCIKVKGPGLLLFPDERQPAIDLKHVFEKRTKQMENTLSFRCRTQCVVFRHDPHKRLDIIYIFWTKLHGIIFIPKLKRLRCAARWKQLWQSEKW